MEIGQTPQLPNGSTDDTDKPGNGDNDSGSQPSQPNYSNALVSCITGYNKFYLKGVPIKDGVTIDNGIGTYVAFYVMIVPVSDQSNHGVTELGHGELITIVDGNQGNGSSDTKVSFRTGTATAKITGKSGNYLYDAIVSGVFRANLSISTSGRDNTSLKGRAFIFQVSENASKDIFNKYAMYSQLPTQATFSPEEGQLSINVTDVEFLIHSAKSSLDLVTMSSNGNNSSEIKDTYSNTSFGVVRDYTYSGSIGSTCKYINRESSVATASINTVTTDSAGQSIKIGGNEDVKSK